MYETAATSKVVRLGRSAAWKARDALVAALVAVGLVLPALVAGSVAQPAHADTTFTVTNTNDTGAGSLRQAILDANNTAGADTINFAIPEASRNSFTGVASISPQTDLPAITERVTINGYSQPGASPNTKAVGDDASLKIELAGGPDRVFGLEIASSSGSVIKGLAISRFQVGIFVHGDSAGNRIEGNFIGLDPFGTFGAGNFLHGVDIQEGPTQTVVGGTTPEKRNVISLTRQGSAITLFDADGNRISGNYVGTDRNGTGTSGTSDGISIFSSSDNTIGGTQAGAGNVISANNFNGVSIGEDSSAGNRVLSNSIFSNGGLGIDLLEPDDNLNTCLPTPNDPKDADTGPNHLQNKPVLSSAKNADGKTTVKGALHSRPVADLAYTVQFFSNPSGTNEGARFVGQKVVKTDGSGDASFTFSPATRVAAGRTITATATRNSNGDTSEFSAPRTVASS